MYSVSQTFLNKIKESSRTINAEVLINTTKLTTEEIASIAVDYSLGEIPGIGNVVSTKLSLKLLRIGNTPSYYTTQTIKPSVAIDDGVGNWMWVPLGTFYPQPDTIKRTDQTIEIECFDILSTLDTINFESSLSYPTSIRNVANEISTKYKIPFKDVNQLPNVNMKVKPEKQSVRAVLAELAELASANAIMDRDGKLTFKIPTNVSFSLDTNNYIDFTLESDNDVKITKLICEKGGQDGKGNEIEDIQVGDTTGATLRFENDSITTQAELQTVYSRIYPMTYTAFELNCQGMPHLEVGDKITLTDKKGVIRTLPLMTHSFTYSGGMLSTFTAKAPSTSSSTGSTGSNSISQAIDKVMADTLTVNNILAGNITADNIAANAITADKIDAKAITADKITASVIDAINLNAGKATIDSAVIDVAEIATIVAQDIKVGNAQITDLEAEKIKTGNLIADVMSTNVINAVNANIGSATIDSAKIGELTADKIQAGVIEAINISTDTATINSAKIGDLSADKITTGTLNADRIGAGSIDADKIKAESITTDKLAANSITTDKIAAGAITADNIAANSITTEKIKADAITADKIGANAITTDKLAANSVTADKIKAGAVEADKISADAVDAIAVNAGTVVSNKLVSGEIQIGDATITDITASKIKGGTLDASLITVKNLNAESITVGTINGHQITGGTITEDNLNLDNLFSPEAMFVRNIKAQEIDAANITTGTISGERIDIKGLVSFESFDEDMQDKFIFNPNTDKTYINGGMIGANTITANSIDLYSGLTVRKEDGTPSFAIAENGEVEVNGLLRSGNYKPGVSGYQVQTSGKAEFNEATIRGSIDLPNAGLTNAGANEFNPVRVWAGASYENRDIAPFRVHQDGSLVALDGTFTGRVYGNYDNDKIHIHNNEIVIDNTSSYLDCNGERCVVMPIDETSDNPHIKLSSDQSILNTDVVFGSNSDKKIEFSNGSNELINNIKNSYYNSKGSFMMNYTGNTSGNYLLSSNSNSGGKHHIKYWDGYGGLIFESAGTNQTSNTEKPYDFKFERTGADVRVKVQGTLEVTESLQSQKQNIEMRSVANEGWGFYAT